MGTFPGNGKTSIWWWKEAWAENEHARLTAPFAAYKCVLLGLPACEMGEALKHSIANALFC